MEEKIYTIPVNEAFESSDGCPFCRLFEKLEKDEVDLILGASMMEPDVRIETNKKGFCSTHYRKMFVSKNRLGLALMLQSHLDTIRRGVETKPSILVKDAGANTSKFIEKLDSTCYICDRIEGKLSKMFETAAILWERDKAFREKCSSRTYFCFPHYKRFLLAASARLSKKDYPEFLKSVNEVEMKYFDKLTNDVSWFCKKFDYLYKDEPWGDSKDAVERAIKMLSGDEM